MECKAESIKAGKEEYKPSLTKAIIRVFGPRFGLIGIFVGIDELGLKVLQPLLISWFIR